MPIDQIDIDRLLVRLRGLVLVRHLLQQRGASFSTECSPAGRRKTATTPIPTRSSAPRT